MKVQNIGINLWENKEFSQNPILCHKCADCYLICPIFSSIPTKIASKNKDSPDQVVCIAQQKLNTTRKNCVSPKKEEPYLLGTSQNRNPQVLKPTF